MPLPFCCCVLVTQVDSSSRPTRIACLRLTVKSKFWASSISRVDREPDWPAPPAVNASFTRTVGSADCGSVSNLAGRELELELAEHLLPQHPRVADPEGIVHLLGVVGPFGQIEVPDAEVAAIGRPPLVFGASLAALAECVIEAERWH